MGEGYCVKCKSKKTMKDEQQVTLKNGRLAAKGKCADCGTSMFKILGKAKQEIAATCKIAEGRLSLTSLC